MKSTNFKTIPITQFAVSCTICFRTKMPDLSTINSICTSQANLLHTKLQRPQEHLIYWEDDNKYDNFKDFMDYLNFPKCTSHPDYIRKPSDHK